VEPTFGFWVESRACNGVTCAWVPPVTCLHFRLRKRLHALSVHFRLRKRLHALSVHSAYERRVGRSLMMRSASATIVSISS
jgi:hypothetical protein